MSIAADDFEAERSRLFGIAYRMTSSAGDADDIVQEAWLRSDRAGSIDNPAAWLTTVATRLALDRLRSAVRRREHYVGPWLPEPLLTDPSFPGRMLGAGTPPAHPADLVIDDETLTLSFLHALDRLEPVERAVFLLREVFAADYAEVATVVGRSESTCRQIAGRSRRRVRAERPRFTVDEARRDELVATFLAAVVSGDPDRLIDLLAEDVVALSDGGAERRAARNPVVGPHRVARYMVNLAARHAATSRLEMVEVNAAPAILAYDVASEDLILVVVLEFDRGLLRRAEAVLPREKLGPLRAELARMSALRSPNTDR